MSGCYSRSIVSASGTVCRRTRPRSLPFLKCVSLLPLPLAVLCRTWCSRSWATSCSTPSASPSLVSGVLAALIINSTELFGAVHCPVRVSIPHLHCCESWPAAHCQPHLLLPAPLRRVHAWCQSEHSPDLLRMPTDFSLPAPPHRRVHAGANRCTPCTAYFLLIVHSPPVPSFLPAPSQACSCWSPCAGC